MHEQLSKREHGRGVGVHAEAIPSFVVQALNVFGQMIHGNTRNGCGHLDEATTHDPKVRSRVAPMANANLTENIALIGVLAGPTTVRSNLVAAVTTLVVD
jgi:hypothetical protein